MLNKKISLQQQLYPSQIKICVFVILNDIQDYKKNTLSLRKNSPRQQIQTLILKLTFILTRVWKRWQRTQVWLGLSKGPPQVRSEITTKLNKWGIFSPFIVFSPR